jgi:uncharacterized protein (TIGR03545 family)
MAKKVPGVFRKPIEEKRFEKRFLKFLEQPDDKKFFKSCFVHAGGVYTVKDALDDKAFKRFGSLFKVIMKNRGGAVQLLPVIAAALLVAGAVFFVTVLMNPLIERGIESALETAFEARSEVDHFRLSLTRLRVSIGGVTVASRDEPMKNLFHIGRMEFGLNPAALFRGRVYIEEIRADSIAFGTPRTVSGELPEYRRRVKAPKAEVTAPPLVDIKNFDAQALLARELDKLKIPKAYEEAAAAYTTAVEAWKERVESARAQGSELQERAGPVLAVNASSLSSPEAITRTVADISALLTSIQAARAQVNGIVEGVENDYNRALDLERSARASITGDINYLKSLVDLGSGAAFNALEPSIRAMLSDAALEYIAYGERALEVFEKIKALAPRGAEKEAKAPAFKGRDVAFPSLVYPRFFLGLVTADFTLHDWNWAFDLKSVSSDPDLPDAIMPNQPTALYLALSDASGNSDKSITFIGTADFRSAYPDRFSAELRGSGYPLSIDSLSSFGFGAFRGLASAVLGFSGRKNGEITGTGTITADQAGIDNPRGTLAEAVDEALRAAGPVDLTLRYEHLVSGKDDFSVSTNIGSLVGDILRRTAERYARAAMADIEKALRDYAASRLEGKFASKEELDLLFDAVKGDRTALVGLESRLDGKRRELEEKLRSAAEEKIDEARRQAEQAIRDQAGNALQGIRLPF